MEHEAGDRVVIASGALAGVEATVVRPTRLFHQPAYLLDLDTAAPRWAAIRRTRVAAWALEAAGADDEQAGRLRWRRRVANTQVVLACLLPLLIVVWDRVPPVGLALTVGWLVAMAALSSIGRHHGAARPAPSSG